MNYSIVKDTGERIQQELKTVINHVTHNISLGFKELPFKIPLRNANITSNISEFQVEPQKIVQFLQRKNELFQEIGKTLNNIVVEKMQPGQKKLCNIMNTFMKEHSMDSLQVVKRYIDSKLELGKIIEKMQEKYAKDEKSLINRNDTSVREIKQQLKKLVDEQITIKTSSGSISGTLLAVEEDYVILGYTILIPLNRIEEVLDSGEGY